MKKISVRTLLLRGLTLALILSISITIIGCSTDKDLNTSTGSKTADGGSTEIVFWTHFGGDDGNYMKKMIEEYRNAHPELAIEHLQVTNEDYYTKFKTGIVSGEGPDISTGDANRLAEFKAADLVSDMTPYAEEAGVDWNSYNQNILNNCTIDGEHLAIPISSYVSLMFANKTLLEDAGMLKLNEKGVIDFGNTPEDFVSFLEEYQSKKPDDVYTIVGGSTGDDPYRFWWSFFGQTGETLLNDDMTKTNINTENSSKTLKLIVSLAEKKLWPVGMETPDQVFLANQAAFYVGGNWSVGALSENSDIDFIAMPIPQVYDQPSAWGGTHVFYLNPRPGQTENQKVEVIRFADWMATNADEWVKAGHLPAKPEVQESEVYKSLTHRDTYEEISNYMLDLPQSQNINAIVEVLRKNMPLALNMQSSVDEVLKNSEQEINDLLK